MSTEPRELIQRASMESETDGDDISTNGLAEVEVIPSSSMKSDDADGDDDNSSNAAVADIEDDDSVAAHAEPEECASSTRRSRSNNWGASHRAMGMFRSFASIEPSVRDEKGQLPTFISTEATAPRERNNNNNNNKVTDHVFVKAKGLNLDLSQPWQRSLLRELEKMDIKDERNLRVQPKPEVMMLLHTSSRDIAYEVDDDVTVGTNASSTVPIKAQTIHRSATRRDQALMDDAESANRSECYSKGTSVPGSRAKRSMLDDHRDESPFRRGTTPRHCNSSRLREDVNDDDASRSRNTHSSRTAGRIPEVLPRCTSKEQLPIHRAWAINEELHQQHLQQQQQQQLQQQQLQQQQQQQPFLEVELSDEADCSQPPESSCFCWGYNVLDFWLPPTSAPQFRRRRVSGRVPTLGGIDELSVGAESANKSTAAASWKSSNRLDPEGSYANHRYKHMAT